MGTDAPVIPLTTWQFFSSCRRVLGDSWLQKLFKRSLRQFQRWSADPAFTAEVERNPVDHYETILHRLMELGREDIARAAVTRQAQIVGCELRCVADVVPDKDSILEELLDDHRPLVEFHEAVRSGQSPVAVHCLYQRAKDELDESYAMYARQYGTAQAGESS